MSFSNKVSVEFELLCHAIMDLSGSSAQSRLDSVGNYDRDKLLALASSTGFSRLLYRYLHQYPVLPNNDIQRFRKAAFNETVTQNALNHELLKLCEAFDKRSVNYVVFKGVAAALQFYPADQHSVRSSVDIDILVDPAQLPLAVDLLLHQGYHCRDCENLHDVVRYVSRYPDWLTKRGLEFQRSSGYSISVDLHWRAINTFSLPLSTTEILDQSERTVFAGREFPVPCLTHHLLLLINHGYQDCFFQLKHLVDIYYALHHPEYRQQNIEQASVKYGVMRQFDRTLTLVDTVFGRERSKVDSYVEFVLDRLIAFEGLPPRAHQHKGDWSLKDKIRYLRYQSRARSEKVNVLAPYLNRLLFHFDMVPTRRVHPLLYWFWAVLKRVTRAVF